MIASMRSTAAGLDIPQEHLVPEPELTLYDRLQDERDDAYLMKPETEKLLATLEVVTEGRYFMSESDEHLTPFAWSTDVLGECSLGKILMSRGLLRTITSEKLIQGWQGEASTYFKPPAIAETCREIINICQSNLVEVKAYEFKNYQEYPGDGGAEDGFDGHDCFQFLVGRTQDGNWIGITPVYEEPHTCAYGEKLVRSQQIASESASGLKQQLDVALSQIHPVIIRYETETSLGTAWIEADTEDEVIEQLFEAAHMLETWSFRSFEKESSASPIYNLQELEKFIETYLLAPKLYIVGNWAMFRFYLTGQLTNGDYLGVSTVTTWT